MLTELFAEIGNLMRVRFVFVFVPWKRCELMVRNHEAWGAIPYVRTGERERIYDFSDPLYIKRTVFFYYNRDEANKKITYDTLQDLSGYVIGGVRGYFYEHLFSEAGLTVEYADSEEHNFRKLYHGRVDLVPAMEGVGWYIIRRSFPPEQIDRFHAVAKPLDTGANYLMTAKDYPGNVELLRSFNEALRTLIESGAYERILLMLH